MNANGNGSEAKVPAITLRVNVLSCGHRVTITAGLSKADVGSFMAWLSEQPVEAIPSPIEWSRTADGEPICPVHRTVMRKRDKQGDVWHSHGVTAPDGRKLYCRGYPGPDSPGYHLPMYEREDVDE